MRVGYLSGPERSQASRVNELFLANGLSLGQARQSDLEVVCVPADSVEAALLHEASAFVKHSALPSSVPEVLTWEIRNPSTVLAFALSPGMGCP